MFFWFGQNVDQEEVNIEKIKSKSTDKWSHDNLFHTLLGLLEIETELYQTELDITKD
jgi:lipid A ethanolaminephosphotransferase